MAKKNWSDAELDSFITILSQIDRDKLQWEDFEYVSVGLRDLGFTRDAKSCDSKFSVMKRNHTNPAWCKFFHNIVNREQELKRRQNERRGVGGADRSPGGADSSFDNFDSCPATPASAYPRSPAHDVTQLLENLNLDTGGAGGVKEEVLEAPPPFTTPPGPTAHRNPQRTTAQQLTGANGHDDKFFKLFLNDRNWNGVTDVLRKLPNLSPRALKETARMALEDDQYEVVELCLFWLQIPEET